MNMNMNTNIMPPTEFDLKRVGVWEVLSKIASLTEQFSILPPEFALNMERNIWYRRLHESTTYGYIPAPPSLNITKQVIGKNGHWLKVTTTNCGVDFIWHDKEKNMFMFWGENNACVSRAMNIIRSRIVNIYWRGVNPPDPLWGGPPPSPHLG